MKRVNVEAKVVEKSAPREVLSRFSDTTHKVATAVIADETGTIKLTLVERPNKPGKRQRHS
jgi:ssDNA-binding replication factor A large subunit